jgi:histidinol-phosphate aminotransferase
MVYFRSNIEAAAGYVPGFQPQNPDVVKLNTNENPYPPSPKVLEALASVDPEKLRRYPRPLGDEFRNSAAAVLGVQPENIICTNGGDDLLTICLRSFCDGGRPLVYASPTYTLYRVLAQIQDCRVIEVPFTDKGGLPAEQLASQNAGMVIVCNPNAPTGTFIPPAQIEELAQKLNGRSVLLVDEAYVDFAEDNCVSLVKKYNNVIILRSMSKGYSLAGIRFGYGIADESLISGMLKVKDSYNVDSLAQTAANAAIQDQRYFKKNVARIIEQREWLTQQLRGLGFDVPQSSTNFLFVKPAGGDAETIYNKLCDKNIYVRYFSDPEISDRLRITVGTARQNEKLIEALKNIL